MILRLAFVSTFLLAACIGIGVLFWQQELQYAQPTPVPADYIYVDINDSVSVALVDSTAPKTVHLHFFNPDCPCSRFNIQHFVSLAKKYGDQVNFYTVIPERASTKYTPRELAQKFNLSVPIIVDRGKTLARSCGVYSTPQAVILNEEGSLFYRGNYNKTRYCTNPNTNFAQQALEAQLAGLEPPDFGPLASVAYGCQIPGKTDQNLSIPTQLIYGNNLYSSKN